MKLQKIISGVYSADGKSADLNLEVFYGTGIQSMPYTFYPGDTVPMCSQIRQWLTAHPEFEISAYVPAIK